MDDILIILLTIVFAFIGVLGQLRKKKQEANPDAGQEKETSDHFWDFLNEESRAGQTPESVLAEEKKSSPIPEPVAEKTKKPVRTMWRPERSSIYARDLTEQAKENLPEAQKKIRKRGVKDRFSLRKGVIYSEILNRKYT